MGRVTTGEREEMEEREESRSPQEPPFLIISKITDHFHAPIAGGSVRWRALSVASERTMS
jgi:hypothetical protein